MKISKIFTRHDIIIKNFNQKRYGHRNREIYQIFHVRREHHVLPRLRRANP